MEGEPATYCGYKLPAEPLPEHFPGLTTDRGQPFGPENDQSGARQQRSQGRGR